MTVRSHVLGRATANGPTGFALFTVPAGEVWLVKEVRCSNLGGTSGTLQLNAQDGAGAIRGDFVHQVLVTNDVVAVSCWTVMEGGDQFAVSLDTGFMYVYVSGSKLS